MAVSFPTSILYESGCTSLIVFSVAWSKKHPNSMFHQKESWYSDISPLPQFASNDAGKFLLSAQRFRCTAYTDDASKDSTFYVGKLRSNFLRTKFTCTAPKCWC
ncbi:unnamed protein product [Fraxinus pennsylvanica]|uniref:Tubby C-terminal domain-containing protein n=1 Tax=Fraxinus pennsylvanica TaxID=56036 RepID=A0AAD2ACG4_9LAMI|nr:unnamed protein product [Fraxinus pennsylvanica]